MAQPRTLVFGGGGVRVIAYIGALLELEKVGLLTEIVSYYGVSAGALVATLMAIGNTPKQLVELLGSFDFAQFQCLDPDVLLDIPLTLGADKGIEMIRQLQGFFKEKDIPFGITFKQFRKFTGKDLKIFATNLNKIEVVCFSSRTTPNAIVIEALRASMSVPGWLTPVFAPDSKYVLVDGGLTNNYPFDQVPAAARATAIGMTFSPSSSFCSKIDNIGSYIEQIVACATLPKAAKCIRKFARQTIVIDVEKFPSFNLELTEFERKWLIERGTDAGAAFVGRVR